MKYILVGFMLFIAALCHTTALAQTETFDLITFTAPKDSVGATWTKETASDKITYLTINKKNNSWCQIIILRSVVSKGSIEKDFESEWQGVIVKSYKPSEAPQMDEEVAVEDWKIRSGWGKFIFNGSDALAGLVTASGHNRCISVVFVTNNQAYLGSLQAFLESVNLKKPEVSSQPVTSQPTIQADNKQVLS